MNCCIAEVPEDAFSGIDCSDDDDSYIEIALDTYKAPTCYSGHEEDKSNLMDEGNCEEYHQLRISISSTAPIPLPVIQETNGVPCMSSSVSQTNEPAAGAGVKISADNRLFFNTSTVSFSSIDLRESLQPEFGQTTVQRTTRLIPCGNVDVLCARKQPNMTTTTTTTNGGMMRLWIKFRGIKIGALLASLVKPRQHCSQNNNGHDKSSRKSKTFFQCYQKRLVNPSNGRCSTVKKDRGRRSKHWDLQDDNSISDSFRSSKKSGSRALEMDLGALRGFFNAVGMSVAQKDGRSKRRTWSKSCDTSPIHEGFSLCSGDNSIQAAIAYCKSSFGQTSDFSF